MTAPRADYAVDRLDDDGGPVASGFDPNRRLVWAPASASRRFDGVWWPRSRDAGVELTALVPAVSEHERRPVTKVSLNIDAWGPDQPRQLRIGGVLTRLGWYHMIDPTVVTLGRGTDDRVVLTVIPSDIDPAAGRDLLRRLAAATHWPDTPAATLAGDWPADDTAAEHGTAHALEQPPRANSGG